MSAVESFFRIGVVSRGLPPPQRSDLVIEMPRIILSSESLFTEREISVLVDPLLRDWL